MNRRRVAIRGWVAVFVAGLTAFYTFRLFFVVFFGKEKTDHAKHAHESPLIITAPLVILAIFAAIGGETAYSNTSCATSASARSIGSP